MEMAESIDFSRDLAVGGVIGNFGNFGSIVRRKIQYNFYYIEKI